MHGQSVTREDLDEISRESSQDKEKEERGKYDDYDKYQNDRFNIQHI